MNIDTTEKETSALEIESQPTSTGVPGYDVGEKGDYNRAGAIDAEEIEHRMTVLEAAKAYPAATFWAFVMSSTIVSSYPP
jgi:MFS transporter, SP family, general alpha glucoside:H+ symporter